MLLYSSNEKTGPLAQRLVHPAHNRAVVGSNPTGSTTAGVAKLVDALDLGSSAFGMGVRVPSPAPSDNLFELFKLYIKGRTCQKFFFVLLLVCEQENLHIIKKGNT